MKNPYNVKIRRVILITLSRLNIVDGFRSNVSVSTDLLLAGFRLELPYNFTISTEDKFMFYSSVFSRICKIQLIISYSSHNSYTLTTKFLSLNGNRPGKLLFSTPSIFRMITYMLCK